MNIGIDDLVKFVFVYFDYWNGEGIKLCVVFKIDFRDGSYFFCYFFMVYFCYFGNFDVIFVKECNI